MTLYLASSRLLKKYWFLVGLAIVISLAVAFPDVARYGGYLHAEWTIKWGAVIIIFFISGLSLRTQTLAETVLRIRLHLLVQMISLVIIPFFVFGFVLFLFKVNVHMDSLLLIGLVIAASTPTTVSSNVVMTKNAGGNEATALMNAATGNLLGIFVSPALVSFFQEPLVDATPEPDSVTKIDGQVHLASVLMQLGLSVLLPLIMGQAVQWMAPVTVVHIKERCRLSDISSIALLSLVWAVFSNAVYAHSFDAVKASDICVVALINLLFYGIFCALCVYLAHYLPFPRLRYSRQDTVAVMYCGATKTVAMGVPLINVLYENADPGTVGVLMTPLLLYHIEQLIVGNIQVDFLKRWIQNDEENNMDDYCHFDEDDDGSSSDLTLCDESCKDHHDVYQKV
ncbi:hypothetical protein K492DRAFT_159234 [Lichtheimia hyalospora FSU 10163]|nr:hypothetical protein K492DRAFT_159234 [Lichtheimia hyalospora FSU 10163]